MQLKDLKNHSHNPRKMTDYKKEILKQSLKKYGDLSGIVYNRRTKQLVGGHQRKSVLPDNTTIKYEKKYDEPTEAYTVAIGSIEIDGENFRYREVDAPKEWEIEALLAANKHTGEWDNDTLRLISHDYSSIDFELTGFDELDLENFGIEDIDLTTEWIKDESESDYEYARKNKGPQEYEGQYLPDTVKRTYTDNSPAPAEVKEIDHTKENPFADVGQKTEVVGKRFVIIIDCEDQAEKDRLKKELRPIIKESRAEIF